MAKLIVLYIVLFVNYIEPTESRGWPFGSRGRRSSSSRSSSSSSDVHRHRGAQPAACEDNDYDDSMSDACISRRLGMLDTTKSALNVVPDGVANLLDLMKVLRVQYINVQNSLSDESDRTKADLNSVYDPSSAETPGMLLQSRAAMLRIMNEEILLAESVNSAWMNLIQIGKTYTGMTRSMANVSRTAAGSGITYFNQQQRAEELATIANINQGRTLLESAMKTVTTDSNTALLGAQNLLNSLDSAIKSSSSDSIRLGVSLQEAISSVNESIVAYLANLPTNYTMPKAASLRTELQTLQTEFQGVALGNKQVYTSTAQNKTGMFNSTSRDQVTSQNTLWHSIWSVSGDDIRKTILDGSASALIFANVSKEIFNSTANVPLVDLVANASRDIISKAKVSNTSTAKNSLIAAAALLANITADAPRKVAAATAKSDAAEAAIASALRSTLGNVSERASALLSYLQSNVSTGAVAAVGAVNGTVFNSLNTLLATNRLAIASGGIRVDSSSYGVTSGLGNTVDLGTQAITDASAAMGTKISTTADRIMDEISGLAAGIHVAKVENITLAPVATLPAGTVANVTVKTLQAATNATSSISSLLEGIDSFSDKATGMYTAGLAAEGAAAATDAALHDAVGDSQVASILANAGETLSSFQSNFLDVLDGLVPVSQPGSVGVAPGSAALLSAADTVESHRAQLMNMMAAQAESESEASGATDSMIDMTARMWMAIRNNFNFQSNKIIGEVTRGQSGIDQAAVDELTAAVGAVTNQLRDITQFESNQAAIISGAPLPDTDQQAIGTINAVKRPLETEISKFDGAAETTARSNNNLRLASFVGKVNKYFDTDRAAALKSAADAVALREAELKNGFGLAVANSTGTNLLNRVELSTSSLLDEIAGNVTGRFGEYMEEFKNLTAGLDLAVKTPDTNLSSTNLISESDKVAMMLLKLADQPIPLLEKMGNMDDLYGNVLSYKNGVNTDVASVNQVVDAHADAASRIVAQLQTNEAWTDVSATMRAYELNQKLAVQKLNEGAGSMGKFAANSNTLSDELSAAIDGSSAVQSNEASFVYDKVLELKQRVVNTLGNMLNKVASDAGGVSAHLETNEVTRQMEANLMNIQISNFAQLFLKENQADNIQFGSSNEQRHKFYEAILMALNTDVGKVSQTLMQDVNGVKDHENELSFRNADLQRRTDPETQTLHSDVTRWTEAILKQISDLKTQEAQKPDLDSAISKAIQSVAQSAAEVIRQNGKIVPERLLEYAGITTS